MSANLDAFFNAADGLALPAPGLVLRYVPSEAERAASVRCPTLATLSRLPKLG